MHFNRSERPLSTNLPHVHHTRLLVESDQLQRINSELRVSMVHLSNSPSNPMPHMVILPSPITPMEKSLSTQSPMVWLFSDSKPGVNK